LKDNKPDSNRSGSDSCSEGDSDIQSNQEGEEELDDDSNADDEASLLLFYHLDCAITHNFSRKS
jgi:hypothetical protein